MSLETEVKETVEAELNELLSRNRELVITELIDGFSKVRKNQLEDLDVRVARFNEEIRRMADDLSVEFVEGEVVVKASGSGALTLRLLKAGSQWFNPVPDVNDRVMRGLYT